MAESKKKKILVVDDEVDIVEMITEYLQSQDFDVISANDGDTAIELAVNQKPDLITLDIMMGQKDGYETCLLLKESNATKSIPVIIITGRGTKQAELASISFGADGYLSKPFELRELTDKINELLR